jgi:hypothetical protein
MPACLVTGVAHPEACHIVPCAVNLNPQNLVVTRSLIDGSRKLLGAEVNALLNLVGQLG